MAKNIEIKAHATNFDAQLKLGKRLADGDSTRLVQTDTFFNSPNGRLKLREFPDQEAQLIYYHRANQEGPKLSDYHITATRDAKQLKYTLSETMGIMAVVKKVRTLLMSGRTRLHFDDVEGLGTFIELEVVLEDSEPIEHGEQEALELMEKLSIRQEDLIDRAYVDLLIDSGAAHAKTD